MSIDGHEIQELRIEGNQSVDAHEMPELSIEEKKSVHRQLSIDDNCSGFIRVFHL